VVEEKEVCLPHSSTRFWRQGLANGSGARLPGTTLSMFLGRQRVIALIRPEKTCPRKEWLESSGMQPEPDRVPAQADLSTWFFSVSRILESPHEAGYHPFLFLIR